jgi:RNA polymerase sigma-70 factor (ECF subfamily)
MSDPADLYERLLVLRCQTGDEPALRELVERFTPRLSYFVRKLVFDVHRADDVIQETWIDVVRQLPKLRDTGAFAPWLYRIARGKADLHFRLSGDALRSSEELLDAAAPADDEEEFTAEDAADVHAALDRLPIEQREVLVLKFLEGLSYEQIADIVGRPTGTVRSRIHYGKQALRRLLAGEPEERPNLRTSPIRNSQGRP